MSIFSQVKAFNAKYQAGDLLLIQDAFGETFVGELTHPAVALDQAVFIRVEHCEQMINIKNVLSKAKDQVSTQVTPASPHQPCLVERLKSRARMLERMIVSYQQTNKKLHALIERSAQELDAGMAKTNLHQHYYALTAKNEAFLNDLNLQYKEILRRYKTRLR